MVEMFFRSDDRLLTIASQLRPVVDARPDHVTIVCMRFRLLAFVLVWVALTGGPCGQQIELEAKSMSKGDLPIGFPTEVLDAGFAVVALTVRNGSDESIQVSPDLIQAWSPKKKRLSRVPPAKILPKMMKFYRGRSGMAGEEIYTGSNVPSGGSSSTGDKSHSAALVERLRVLLEGYQLKEGSLDTEESVQGYLYLKSKKRGAQLSGGRVELGGAGAVIE